MAQAEVHREHHAVLAVVDRHLCYALLGLPRVEDRAHRWKWAVLNEGRIVSFTERLAHALKPARPEVPCVLGRLRQVRLAPDLPRSLHPPRRLDRDAAGNDDRTMNTPGHVRDRYASTRPRHVEHVRPQHLALVDQHGVRVQALDGARTGAAVGWRVEVGKE